MKEILLRGTLEEVVAEYESRLAQGFDGGVAGPDESGDYTLLGTPEEWYCEPGHGVDEGQPN